MSQNITNFNLESSAAICSRDIITNKILALIAQCNPSVYSGIKEMYDNINKEINELLEQNDTYIVNLNLSN
jgi:hypothetical protein